MLLAHGRVRRAWLGLAAQHRPLDRALGRRLGILATHVVEIVAVEPGGPAAVAGLLIGDWILAVDGHPTATVDELHRQLAAVAIGVPVVVATLRDGARRETGITPQEAR